MLVVAVSLCLPRCCSADVIIDWNNQLLETIRSGSLPPPPATRVMAMINTAIYDAVNSISGTHEPYYFVPTTTSDPLTSKEAAAAQAAYRVVSTAFPANQSIYDAALADSLASFPTARTRPRGSNWAIRRGPRSCRFAPDDGAGSPIPYTPSSDPGRWQPTPPAFAPAAVPHWANVTPWTMTSNSQFRDPVGPPALDGAEYAAAFNEIKEIGSVNSTTRTEDQTNIAKFWAGRTGTSTPAGQWNRIAQTVAENEGNSLEENARLFAFVGLSQADAVISSWDNKYHFDYWRPVTAIRAADTDGNPATEPDPDWLPLIGTPNFPTYTAAHGTASGATSKILELFYGRDDISFTSSTEGYDDVPDRTFTSFLKPDSKAPPVACTAEFTGHSITMTRCAMANPWRFTCTTISYSPFPNRRRCC